MTRSVTERHRDILQLVAESSPRRLADLTGLLGVSAVTLRRDVEELAAQGLVRRSHGAISAVRTASQGDGPQLTVGIVVPHAEYYFGEVISGIRAAAARAGVRLTLGVSSYDVALEQHLVRGLVQRGVDGILVAPTPDFSTGELSNDVQDWLMDIPVPIVLLERPVQIDGRAAAIDSVFSAHSTGCATAVRHLAELGHTHIALAAIEGPNTPLVRDGYRRAVESCGLVARGEVYDKVGETAETAAQAAQLVNAGVTALVVHNDQLAMRLLGQFEVLGVRVPDDVSLVCYDDISAELAEPALTAVAPQKTAVGERALDLLLDRIHDGGNGGGERVALLPLLHVRESTVAPAERAAVDA